MAQGSKLLFALAALALLVWASACANDPTLGYSTQPTFPTAVASVGVTVFENDTYEREIEFELADALQKGLQRRTPYRVTSADDADSILSGRVVRIERDQISKSPTTGLSQEVLLSVTVDFEWRDVRTGETLLERRAYTADALFVPSQPLSEPIELGRFAAVEKLAEGIIEEMRSDW